MLLFVYTTTRKRFVIFTCRYFKLSWNTAALSQSNCRSLSCSGIKVSTIWNSAIWSVPSCESCNSLLVSVERRNEGKRTDKEQNLNNKKTYNSRWHSDTVSTMSTCARIHLRHDCMASLKLQQYFCPKFKVSLYDSQFHTQYAIWRSTMTCIGCPVHKASEDSIKFRLFRPKLGFRAELLAGLG